ncbi:MAG: MAPEG family protein [Sphingobium sp.]
MSTELIVLAWGCILALVHIFAAGNAKTRQYGAKWNMGPRDGELPPPDPLVGRLMRAQANYLETFPVMIAAVAIVSIAGLSTRWTEIGAIVWIAARIVYLPLYAAGVPGIRSLVFMIGLVGMLMVLWPALF